MKNLVSCFLSDKSGATAIEYGLIAVFIGLAMAVGATLLGNNLNTLFTSIGNSL